jgi:glycosyltransferase involved in cell wall biosynthesis
VYPVSWDFAAIADAIPFRGTIADVVDDERAWATASEQVQRVDANYREILSRAQLTFTNCRPLAESLAEYAMDIRVVPNGAESPEDLARVVGSKPVNLRKPVIGYVGDLRNRIDWELVRKIAEGRREWSIVLVGPGRGIPEAKALNSLPNVAFAGTVPYAEIPQWLTLFDVAILPHTVDRITSCMNPLKAYQYLANGLPVVSTDIQNLSGVDDLVTVAATHRDFIVAVERALKAPRPTKPALRMLMSKIGWTSRINSMIEAIDEVFG